MRRSVQTYNQMIVDRASGVDVDRIFHALADGTRRDILALAAGGRYSVSALAKRYPMSFAAVQKHVAVLEGARLVTKERRGRERLVRTSALVPWCPAVLLSFRLLAVLAGSGSGWLGVEGGDSDQVVDGGGDISNGVASLGAGASMASMTLDGRQVLSELSERYVELVPDPMRRSRSWRSISTSVVRGSA